jgi:hypothetical protein
MRGGKLLAPVATLYARHRIENRPRPGQVARGYEPANAAHCLADRDPHHDERQSLLSSWKSRGQSSAARRSRGYLNLRLIQAVGLHAANHHLVPPTLVKAYPDTTALVPPARSSLPTPIGSRRRRTSADPPVGLDLFTRERALGHGSKAKRSVSITQSEAGENSGFMTHGLDHARVRRLPMVFSSATKTPVSFAATVA